MSDYKSRSIEVIDLDKDFEASAKRLEELRKGRSRNDIPIWDEYWKAQNKHRQAHGSSKGRTK